MVLFLIGVSLFGHLIRIVWVVAIIFISGHGTPSAQKYTGVHDHNDYDYDPSYAFVLFNNRYVPKGSLNTRSTIEVEAGAHCKWSED